MCNILPKKNWHVLKKENIDRVRRDEARAAEEEKARLRKIAIAEKEARTDLLRDKARASRLSRDADEAGTSSLLPISFTSASLAETNPRTHINFFKESEAGNSEEKANEERKREEKEEQEKWERKVGISMALGQTPGGPLDSQLNPWWMQAKKHKEKDEEEEDEKDVKSKKLKGPERKPVLTYKEKFDADKLKREGRCKRDEKRKRQMDPMMEVAKQLSKHKKHKKDKHSYDDKVRSSIRKERKEKKDSKKKTIEELRAERLRREGKERTKTLDFLGGKPSKKEREERQEKDRDSDKSYFNSQFFPELARKKKQ